MENMAELADQQMSDTASVSVSVTPTAGSENTTTTDADIIAASDLSPTISSSGAIAVSVANMIDSNEYRSQMPEPTYHTLNGRMSPGYNTSPNNYATLTPLQPLPPISTVSDKFGHVSSPNVSGSFTLMQNNSLGMDMNSYARYDKIGQSIGVGSGMGVNVGHVGGPLGGATSPMSPMSTMSMMSSHNGYAQPQTLGSYPTYSQNGLHSPKQEHKPMMSPINTSPYDSYSMSRGLGTPTSTRLHSPNPMMPTTMNGLHHSQSPTSPHNHHHVHPLTPRDRPPSSADSQNSKQELEEINTKELAQKISSELKRYSIPQAVFAQRVLCRSQGTLSDLLRNPKPWSKLKSGRETFRRMWKWLQEPEFQRMSALRLAGKDNSSITHTY